MPYACTCFGARQRKTGQHARRLFIQEPHVLEIGQHKTSCSELTLADASIILHNILNPPGAKCHINQRCYNRRLRSAPASLVEGDLCSLSLVHVR